MAVEGLEPSDLLHLEAGTDRECLIGRAVITTTAGRRCNMQGLRFDKTVCAAATGLLRQGRDGLLERVPGMTTPKCLVHGLLNRGRPRGEGLFQVIS